MNPILETIIDQRNGHYCHCVEVSDTYELESIAEQIISEFQDNHSEATIIDFLESLAIYSLDDDNEQEIFDFSFTDYVKDTI
jgi:hypothetical protein